MKVLELFAGTRSIGKAFEKNGHGVQGVKGAAERSRIPDKLCEYVVELCEKGLNNKE